MLGLFHIFSISKFINSDLIFYRIAEKFYAEWISLVMLLLCTLMFDSIITKLHLNWHRYVHFPAHANNGTFSVLVFKQELIHSHFTTSF